MTVLRHIFLTLSMSVVFGLTALAPAQADRDLPDGTEPDAVLSAFFEDLRGVIADPANADLGLMATYNAVGGYWIPTSQEMVAQSGEVPDLNSVMFFQFNQPQTWEIDEVRTAGDFARGKIVFHPSARNGIQRDEDYEPIEATFNLVRQSGEWYIVDFKGPERAPRPEPLEDMIATADDTPETLVTRLMEVLVAQLRDGIAANALRVAAAGEGLWADTRDARKASGKFYAILGSAKPQGFVLDAPVVSGDHADLRVSLLSGAADLLTLLGYQSDENGVIFNFSAEKTDGIWLLNSVGP